MNVDPGIWTNVALLAVGVVVGLVLSRFVGGPWARIRTLQGTLREERERSAAYKEAVARHFGETSEKFRELTHQYSALYAHLAAGARDLCAERLPLEGGAFAERPLTIGSREGEPAFTAEKPSEGGEEERPQGTEPAS